MREAGEGAAVGGGLRPVAAVDEGVVALPGGQSGPQNGELALDGVIDGSRCLFGRVDRAIMSIHGVNGTILSAGVFFSKSELLTTLMKHRPRLACIRETRCINLVECDLNQSFSR